MRSECTQVAVGLADVDRVDQLDRRSQRHLSRCLRCQAEAVRDRRLRRALAGLRTDRSPEEPRVLAGILATLDAYDAKVVARRSGVLARAAIVAGGMATAGAAAAVLVTLGRRGHRLGLAG